MVPNAIQTSALLAFRVPMVLAGNRGPGARTGARTGAAPAQGQGRAGQGEQSSLASCSHSGPFGQMRDAPRRSWRSWFRKRAKATALLAFRVPMVLGGNQGQGRRRAGAGNPGAVGPGGFRALMGLQGNQG